MIPELSSTPVPASFVERVSVYNRTLLDYENGGPELGEQTDEVSYEWEASSDGHSIWVSREGVSPILVLESTNISHIALAFDQTMNPHVAYISNGVVSFYWFDTLLGDFTTMILPGTRSPQLCSDEKNPLLSSDRDIILAYIKDTDLCIRVQRERFQTEHVFATGIAEDSVLAAIGMNIGRRLQFQIVTPPTQYGFFYY